MKRTGSGQKRQGEQLSNQVATKGSRRSNPTSHTVTTSVSTDDSAVAELSSKTTDITSIMPHIERTVQRVVESRLSGLGLAGGEKTSNNEVGLPVETDKCGPNNVSVSTPMVISHGLRDGGDSSLVTGSSTTTQSSFEDVDENEDEKEALPMPAVPADWHLNSLLVKIANEMTDNDLDAAKAVFKGVDGLGRRLLSQIENPLQFFNSMQKHMFLSRDNMLFLQAMLFTIGRMDLYDMAIDYAQRLGDVIYFCKPPPEPANGYRYIQFHIKGKDFTKVKRSDLEALRMTAARLMLVPPQFVVIAGIEKSSSLKITIMVPEMFVKYFEAALTMEPAVQELTNLGIDIVRIDDKVINIHDRAFAGQRSVSKMADDSAIQTKQVTDTKGIKQCDFVIETDDVLTAEAVDSRCQTAKSVSENLADFLTSSMSLSTLYDEIVAKAKVDHSRKEIQDISSAVEEMLKRLVSDEIELVYEDPLTGKGPTLKFRGADLQPCGSMPEKTLLWKSTRRRGRQNKFLEPDYVVILHNEDNEVRIESGDCTGCRRVVIRDRHWRAGKTLDAKKFNRAFLKALYSLIDSKCSCHVDPDQTFSKDDRHDSRPCPECTVAKDTGRLQIAKIPDFSPKNVKGSEDCSIVFFWTSYTDCLLVPNMETLQTTERIGRLVIRVDVLSAFTLPDTRDGDKCEKELFIIGKPCPYCNDKHFMVSYCMQELRALKRVSDQQKQCYIIIKFLYGQFIYWTGQDKYINSYYAKVAFLTHCQTCTDKQKDCTTCITKILQSLVEAYRSDSLRLPEFHPVKSLAVDHYGYDDVMKAYQIPILCLLHVLSQLKTQYRPCHVVGLIKRTCRILLEQDRPGIMDIGGRPFENTVSTEDILVVLLTDEELCYRVVYFPYHDVEKLYRRLDCPEPERGLLRWRATCMANMILASDITHIRDETIKKAVGEVQDRVEWRRGKQLLFLTSSQSVTGMPNNDPETSSLTPNLDGSCNDTTGRSVPADSIFTDDLQLNWSTLNFTELREKMRKLAAILQQIEEGERLAILQEEEKRLAEETERRRRLAEETERERRFFEETEKERREMIQKLKSKKDENETTTDADQMQVQPTDVIHEVDSSGETDDESALKNGEEDTTINLERKTTVEKKGDRKRKDEAEGSIIIKAWHKIR